VHKLTIDTVTSCKPDEECVAPLCVLRVRMGIITMPADNLTRNICRRSISPPTNDVHKKSRNLYIGVHLDVVNR